jgi:hypothetical protein
LGSWLPVVAAGHIWRVFSAHLKMVARRLSKRRQLASRAANFPLLRDASNFRRPKTRSLKLSLPQHRRNLFPRLFLFLSPSPSQRRQRVFKTLILI